jgi:hypothetical protein
MKKILICMVTLALFVSMSIPTYAALGMGPEDTSDDLKIEQVTTDGTDELADESLPGEEEPVVGPTALASAAPAAGILPSGGTLTALGSDDGTDDDGAGSVALTADDYSMVHNCNLGFHCSDYKKGESGGKEQNPVGYAKGSQEFFGQVSPGVWVLLKVLTSDSAGNPLTFTTDTDYVCPDCGGTTWVSYSNKSDLAPGQAFDGKNIQVNHYFGVTPEATFPTISFKKVVDGSGIWPADGFTFNLYKVNNTGAKTFVQAFVVTEDNPVVVLDGSPGPGADWWRHTIDTYKTGQYMFCEVSTDGWEQKTYLDGLVFNVSIGSTTMDTSTQIITTHYIATWTLEDDADDDGVPVVLNTPAPQTGSLKVTASVVKQHDEQDFAIKWTQDYAKVWAQDFALIWAQDWAKNWVQDYANEYTQDYATRWAQDYVDTYIPVFQSKTMSVSGTLVSGITYGYGADGKGSIPGGYLGNGMTYLTINLKNLQAAGEDGMMVFIADSSPNSNGKKLPTEYNKNIGYYYTLTADNNNVYLKVGDDSLVSTSFGFLVQNAAFNGNPTSQIKHDNIGTKALPKPDKDGNIFVFFHAEGVKWNSAATSDYKFVNWEFLSTDKSGALYEVGTFPVGDKSLVGTFPVGDEREDGTFDIKGFKYPVGMSDVGKAHFVKKIPVGQKHKIREFSVGAITTVEDDYAVDFSLVVTDENGDEVYSGPIANGGEVVIDDLPAGEYTATLSSDDFADQVKSAVVVVNSQVTIAFDDIAPVQGDKQQGSYNPDFDIVKTGKHIKAKDITIKGKYIKSEDTTIAGKYRAHFDTHGGVGDYLSEHNRIIEDITGAAALVITPGDIGEDDEIVDGTHTKVYLGTTDPNNSDSILHGKYTPPLK